MRRVIQMAKMGRIDLFDFLLRFFLNAKEFDQFIITACHDPGNFRMSISKFFQIPGVCFFEFPEHLFLCHA